MHEFRPRPACWRLALVSLSQLLIAAWIANAAVSMFESFAMHDAGLRAWIVYASPFDTARLRLEPEASDVELVRRIEAADRVVLHAGGWFAAGGVLLALLIVSLWPAGPALASRMFGYNFAAVITTFGVARLGRHEVRGDLPPAAIVGSLALVAGVIVAAMALRRMLVLLGNVYDVKRALIRVAVMLTMLAPFCIFVSAISFRGAALYAALLAIAGGMAAALSVPSRFEQLTRVELREALVPLIVAAMLICAASLRVVMLREGVTIEEWPAIRTGIPLEWPLSNADHAPRHRSARVPSRR